MKQKHKLLPAAGFEPNAFYERERIEHNHASRYLQVAGGSGRARCLILRSQTPALAHHFKQEKQRWII